MLARRAATAALLFVVTAGVTDAGHASERIVTFRPSASESELPARFRLPAHQFAYEQTVPNKWLGTIPQSLVTFPSPVTTPHAENNTVHCEYFEPLAKGKRPGVIVLHILGGDFELSRLCCRSLAASGTAALFVKMPYYGPRRPADARVRMVAADPHQTVRGMTQAVLDIRRAAAWLSAQDNVDEDRLGITGISLGGIVSALAASIEPRFTRVCLVLAGGDVGKAIWNADELSEARDYWKELGITRQDLIETLRPIDPLTHARRLRGRRILMINAKHDEVIPRACTDSLWKAIGQPEIIWWDAGHYSAALYLPGGLVRIARFFADESNPDSVP